MTSPLFPSGVTAVFRVFPNGLSTPLLGRLFGLPPLATAHNLPHPCRPCLSSRLSAPAAEFGCRTQSAFGARPRHSAGRCLSAPAKATPGRVGRRRSGRGAPGRAVPIGPAPRTPVSWGLSERDAPRRPRRRGRGAGNFLETAVLFCVGDSGGLSSQAYRRPHGTAPLEDSLDRLLSPHPPSFLFLVPALSLGPREECLGGPAWRVRGWCKWARRCPSASLDGAVHGHGVGLSGRCPFPGQPS